MTDEELRAFFDLTERALLRLRAGGNFPKRDVLVNKTDRRAVEIYFDRRAGILSSVGAGGLAPVVDGKECFDDEA